MIEQFAKVDPLLILFVFVAAFGALVTHEGAHYAVARLLRCHRASLHVRDEETPLWAVWAWQPFVEFEIRTERSVWVDRAVSLAPIASGLGVLAGALVIGWRPSSVWDAPLIVGWVIHTLMGGLEDYSTAIARGGSVVEWSLFARQLAGGVGVWLLGVAVNQSAALTMLLNHGKLARMATILIVHAGVAFMLAGLIVVGLAIKNTDTIPESSILRTPIGDFR